MCDPLQVWHVYPFLNVSSINSWLPATGVYACVPTPTFAAPGQCIPVKGQQRRDCLFRKKQFDACLPIHVSPLSCLCLHWTPQWDTMEMECVAAEEDNRRLTQLRFDAAVKVIKSLPPDGKHWQSPCNTRPTQDLSFKQPNVSCGQVHKSSSSAWLGSWKVYKA